MNTNSKSIPEAHISMDGSTSAYVYTIQVMNSAYIYSVERNFGKDNDCYCLDERRNTVNTYGLGEHYICILVISMYISILMSISIAARMLQLLGLPTLLYQPEVHTNLEVTVLYTQVNVMGLLFVTAKLAIDH